MGYRLIALDIDGTIRKMDRPPSFRTHQAIEAAKKVGASVTLVTGRMFKSAISATSQLDITSPIVSFQGAHIANPKTGEILHHVPLEPEMCLKALNELSSWPKEILAYIGNDVHANVLTPWVEAYGDRNKGSVHITVDMHRLAVKKPTRLAVLGDENEISDLEATLKAKVNGELYVTRSLPTMCEILHPDGNKKSGLIWLSKHLNISRRETIVCGNSYEDVEMMRWSGLSIASSEAVPEAKLVADLIARPIEEDGIAKIIEDLISRGEIG